jgi:IclR family acetate operon transcriptional repressor
MASSQIPHEANQVQTVLKALDVLECLAAAQQPLSAPEVSRRCHMSRPTAYRFLVTLSNRGYVTDLEDGTYRLGPRVLSLGSNLLNSLDLFELSKPDLYQLCHAANETAHLSLVEGLEILYINKVESSQSLRLYSKIGSRNALYCTAMGKAILAFLPQEERNVLLERIIFLARTPNTFTNRADLEQDLALTRERGFAIDDMEGEEGVRCVGAPIFDHTGRAFAALSISGPAYRLSLDRLLELAPLVIQAADSVSGKLGYVPVT